MRSTGVRSTHSIISRSRRQLSVACQGIVANEQPTLVENTLEDPRWPARPRDINRGFSRSASGVPLREGDYVVGVLTLARDNLPFTDEDLAVLAGVVAPVEELVLTSHAR
jgi:GAF domain-containing protein